MIYPPPTRRHTDIVFGECGKGLTSAPPRVKKELTLLVKKAKLWWEEELELQASLARHPNDPKDPPSQRLLEARSFNKVQLMDNATASLLSALDSGNFIELDDDCDDELEDGSNDGD
jgi:hypothetical protein